MTRITDHRIGEVTTTTGTGPFATTAALTSHVRASTVCSIGDTFWGDISAYDTTTLQETGDWVTGLCTYSAANEVTMTTVYRSSNANLAVTFPAGSKRIRLIADARQIAKLENLTGTNTGDQTSIVGITGTIAQFNTAVTDADLATLAANTFTGDQQLASGTTLNWNNDTFTSRRAAATFQFGAADAASPVAQTIAFQGSRGGTDTNVAAVQATVVGSLGTGTGTVGDVVVQTGTVAASGSTQHAAATRLTINSTAMTGTVPFRAPAGATTSASYGFAASVSTGLYSRNSNTFTTVSANTQISEYDGNIKHGSTVILQWWGGSFGNVAADIGVTRNAAGVLEVNSATGGTFRDLKLRGLWFGSTLTVGTLPSAASSEGLIYRVSDSSAPAVGSTVASGGSTKCSVQSDASNWKVVWIA